MSKVCWVRALIGDSAQLRVKCFNNPSKRSQLPCETPPLYSVSAPLNHRGGCSPSVDNLSESFSSLLQLSLQDAHVKILTCVFWISHLLTYQCQSAAYRDEGRSLTLFNRHQEKLQEYSSKYTDGNKANSTTKVYFRLHSWSFFLTNEDSSWPQLLFLMNNHQSANSQPFTP